MRVAKEIQKQGKFWMPNNPEKYYQGSIVIADGGICEIEILNFRRTFSLEPRDIDELHAAIDGIGNCVFTNCLVISNNLNINGTKSIIKPSICFLNSSNFKTKYTEFRLKLEGLSEWISQHNYEVENTTVKKIISYGEIEDIKLSANPDILIKWDCITDFKSTSLQINYKEFILFKYEEEKSINDVLSDINSARHFFALFSGTLFNISSLSAIRRDLETSIYFNSVHHLPDGSKYSKEECLLSFDNLKEDIEKTYKNWEDEVYNKIWPAISNYFSANLSHDYINQKILKLSFGLESFHSAIYPEYRIPNTRKIYFRDRINHLIERLSPELEIYENYVTEIKNFRNAEAHLNDEVNTYREDNQLLIRLLNLTTTIFSLSILKLVLKDDSYKKTLLSHKISIQQHYIKRIKNDF